MATGTLYVVATPIGNLEDITLRALAVLRAVSVIACEDTRRTRVLLDRHGIDKPLVSFHKFNERKASASLVARLTAGEDVAVVSDGGTPAVSDPGYRLVRDALDAGAVVTPVPGPSAFVAAVSASGLPSETVTFRGFLPHRSGERRRMIESIREETATQVFYESPRRAAAALRDLAEILGERHAAVARELTKRFETWHRGALSEVAEQVAKGPAKGEFCIVVEGAPSRPARRRVMGSAGGPHAAPGVLPEAGYGHDRSPQGEEEGGTGYEAAHDRSTGPEGDTTGRARPVGDAPGRPQPAGDAAAPVDPRELRRAYENALARGLDHREALREAARVCGLSRKEAYRVLKASH